MPEYVERILSVLLAVLAVFGASIVTGVVAFKYAAPEECQWGFLAADTDDVGLMCRLRSLNGDSSYTNFSTISVEHTASLRIDCDDGILVQSTLPNRSLEHLTQLQELRIEHCKLAELSSLAFAGLHNLRNLTVRSYDNEWPGMSLQIDGAAFRSLPQLEKLDLGYNAMWMLPFRPFCSLLSLINLNLTHNHLQEVDSLGFGINTPQQNPGESECPMELKELDLSYNDIHVLPNGGFANLRRLRKLDLQYNQITLLAGSALMGLNTLQILNIANNKLIVIPEELLQNTSDLVELYLQNNSLSSLAPRLLSGLQQLLVLDLTYNELTNSLVVEETFRDLIRLVVLNLSHNKLSRVDNTIFRNLYSLQILRMEYNNIESISDHAFSSMYNLHTLLLSHNKLTHVDAYTFDGLYVLSLLSLDFNNIETIHPDAFRNCSGLQDLNLHGNKLRVVPEAIRMLQFLKTLDMGLNNISSLLNASFRGLQQLTGLILIDNSIRNLTRGTFDNMTALKILNLARNNIYEIEHGTFDANYNLQAIRLDSNFLTEMNGLFTELPALIWLNISANQIIWFDYFVVPLDLQWLDIHANQITELGNYLGLESKLRLQIMDASSNHITKIGASDLPDGIQLLFLNDNRITRVQPYTFLKKHNLSRVDLFGNNIEIMDLNALRLSPYPSEQNLPEFYLGGNPFQCDCNMEWLQRINHLDQLRQHPRVMDLDSIYCRLLYNRERSYIPLVEAQSSHFLCPYTAHCFTLCQCCVFDACDCEMLCPDNCTCYHDQGWSANIVVCTEGNYTEMPQHIPMDATEIYLDGNNMKVLSSHTFIGRKNMRVLFLNNSHIQTINNRTFNGLKSLQILHLETNILTELRGFEFERLENLKELYLQNNRLQTIHNSTFVMLKSLEILHLEGNLIIEWPVWTFTSNIALRELSLSNNPWTCDCHFMDEFHVWLVGFQDKVKDTRQIKCMHNEIADHHNPPGIQVFGFNATMCDNATATSVIQPRLVQDYLPVLIIALGSCSAVVLVVLLLVIFRNEMRVWIYSRYGLRLFSRRESDAEDGKIFDAFVSYSSKDENFVVQVLAPELECGRSPYALCLHYRDFPVGAYVTDTIIEAVESSSRTILVLSENFIKSEWCRYEFKSAYHQVLKDRKRRLIVISLGELAQRDLDPDIRLYLKTNIYLRWGDKLFWEKLRFAMPEVKHRKHYHHNRENAVRSAAIHI